MAISTLMTAGLLALAAGSAAISAHWMDTPIRSSQQTVPEAMSPACEVDFMAVAMGSSSVPPEMISRIACNDANQAASLQTASLNALDRAFPR